MYLLSGLKTQDPLISHCRWLSGMLQVGRLLSGLCSCWVVCYIIVVRNSYVVMKEGSTVSLVCVRECWVDVALIQSCPRVLTKTWNDHQLLWQSAESNKPVSLPARSLHTFKSPVSVAAVLSRRGLCSGPLLKGIEITSGFRMSLYVIVPQKKKRRRKITWPCMIHTLLSYQRFGSFAQKCPEGGVNFWNTCIM